jgi:hypothetical protein
MTVTGGSGSSAGNQYEIQMSDGSAGFVAAGCNRFSYDYTCQVFYQIGTYDHGMGNYAKYRVYSDDCEAFVFQMTDCGGTDANSVHAKWVIGNNGSCNNRLFMVTNSVCAGNLSYWGHNPWTNENVHFYNDGMNCYTVGVGFDTANCFGYRTTYTCKGSSWIGWCGSDNIRFCLNTYNDYIHWEDNQVTYAGCCNLQWTYNNGCNNGYNVWTTKGSGLGLVISSDDGCCLCPLILAQGLCSRACFDSSGMFVVSADTNLAGCVCVQGNSGFTGTFDTASNTQIFITCGIITGIA